jgi:hypothetical protein
MLGVDDETVTAELVLPSGRVVLLEAPAPTGGNRDVGLRDKIPFKDLLADLQEMSTLLLDTTRAIGPTEAEIELSLGVEAASGRLVAFMVDGKVSGGMKLRLTWKG